MSTTLERKRAALFYKAKITVYDKEIVHVLQSQQQPQAALCS